MFRMSNKKSLAVMAVGALTLAIVAVGAFGAVGAVSASSVTATDLETMTQASTNPGLLSDGYLSHGRGWEFLGRKGAVNYQAALADALGITTEELDDAYETAQVAAIEEAVDEGLITQERADAMLARDGTHLFGLGNMRQMPKGVDTGVINEHAFLADALGISPDALTAAREQANETVLAQALEEGIVTQEQVDSMQARKDVADYIDQKALMAGALGLTVEELEAKQADGETMRSLMDQQGMDAAALRESMATAYEAALTEAVADGVITQEQADSMTVSGGRGAAMPGRMGERGDREDFDGSRMPRDRGDSGGRRPGQLDDDVSGMGFRFSGRATVQADSDL